MDEIHPRVLAGLAEQLDRRRRTLDGGALHVGRKMGRGVEEVGALTGAGPVIGHLTTARRPPTAARRASARARGERLPSRRGVGSGRAGRADRGRTGSLVVDGAVRGTVRLLDGYAETVRDAAVVLGALGERLRAGDRLIAGSIVHVPVAPGDRIDGLGRVSVTIG